jgi:predicted transcriptional regulator
MRDFKYNNRRSKFAQHLLEKGHAIGKMEDIMKVIHVTRKGRMLNTSESFHIYKETKAENQINDKLTAKGNEIFKAILQRDP